MSKYSVLLELADFLDEYRLNVNSYYEDGEYSSLSDSVIYGKIEALRSGLRDAGFPRLVDTVDRLDLSPGNVIQVLETLRAYVIAELRRQVDDRLASGVDAGYSGFWERLHPTVEGVARSRFQSGHYADAVEAALKEVNSTVKAHVKTEKGIELDGVTLMQTAFSPKNPIITLADLSTDSGKNIQTGYMELFAGAIRGVRNPKAHENIEDDPRDAIHSLFLASLLMFAFDNRIPRAH